MGKKLCEKGEKIKIELQKNIYVCKKCNLLSDNKKKLCKPEKNK
jgi:hypothetical protein